MASVPVDAPAPLLRIEQLAVALPAGADRSHAVRGVSIDVQAGEVVCLVGESGSGKSLTASAVMRLLPDGVRIDGGSIFLQGVDLARLDEAQMRALRGARMAMIFQEPMTALNPLHRVGDQIAETFRIHTDLDKAQVRERVLALLTEVQLPDPAQIAHAYPHELSGGQRQRAMIAMALALEPQLLIADEPTTALDVTTQAQILKLIRELQARRGTAVLFITHDFGVVAEIADRVAVMKDGELVEQGDAAVLLNAPSHPYTQALIAAVPSLVSPPARPLSGDAVLSVQNVSKTFRTGGLLAGGIRITKALDRVTLSLPRGATLGVVGESGSGKSTLARCIMRLLAPDNGHVLVENHDWSRLKGRASRAATRHVQMVFQDPFASLNPRRRAGELVAQGPIAHGTPRAQALARAAELFELVGLDPRSVDRFPHEFSGGQRQRIGLARALALEPRVLVTDEPVSALDVSVQAQVLRLLQDLKDRLNLSMIFVTHDLRVAAQVCDLLAVMQSGRVVEAGRTAQVLTAPTHEYTQSLVAAIPGRAWFATRLSQPVQEKP